MSIETMKQALKALEANQPINYCMNGNGERFPMFTEDPFRQERNENAITALRAAIEQGEEPVAWMYDFLSDNRDEVIRDWMTQDYADIKRENGFNVRPLYTVPPAAPKPYRRGTYVRCMESDELCRVYTTSIDGGAWVKWPDGSITTYTAEQMGQAFSLEQAAPGKPVAYADQRIHGWPDCFVMEPDPPHTVPLYTEPKEWVGLTDDERAALLKQATYMDEEDCEHLLMLAEAKLKERNA
jgi:hypothetical protein